MELFKDTNNILSFEILKCEEIIELITQFNIFNDSNCNYYYIITMMEQLHVSFGGMLRAHHENWILGYFRWSFSPIQ